MKSLRRWSVGVTILAGNKCPAHFDNGSRHDVIVEYGVQLFHYCVESIKINKVFLHSYFLCIVLHQGGNELKVAYLRVLVKKNVVGITLVYACMLTLYFSSLW